MYASNNQILSYENLPSNMLVSQPQNIVSSYGMNNIRVDNKRMFSNEIVRECYNTHENLIQSEKEWGIEATSNILMTDPEVDGRWPNMVLFILHGCKLLSTGKLSFIYNFELDDAIRQRNIAKLTNLLKLEPADIWQEKTKNELLTLVEQEELTKTRNKEMIVVMNVVAEGKNMKAPYMDNFIVPCESSTKKHSTDNTVYTSCYRGVCVDEANKKRTNNIMSCNLGVCERITVMDEIDMPDMSPEIIMVQIPNYTHRNVETERLSVHQDLSQSNINTPKLISVDVNSVNTDKFSENELRCYDFNILIDALSLGEKIGGETRVVDPITNEIFPLDISDVLREKFQKEIKMYKFFINYINNLR